MISSGSEIQWLSCLVIKYKGLLLLLFVSMDKEEALEKLTSGREGQDNCIFKHFLCVCVCYVASVVSDSLRPYGL